MICAFQAKQRLRWAWGIAAIALVSVLVMTDASAQGEAEPSRIASEALEAEEQQRSELHDEAASPPAKLYNDYGELLRGRITLPLPQTDHPRPLFAGKPDDVDKLGQLLEWLASAEPVDGAGLTTPQDVRGRSVALRLDFSGQRVPLTVRPAWSCVRTEDEWGQGVSCSNVPDYVWLQYPDETSHFAYSPALHRFVTEVWMDDAWMQQVKALEAPERIAIGQPFTVSGDGWLTERIRLELVLGTDVYWSRDVDVVFGQFAQEALLEPSAERPIMASSQYMLSVKTLAASGEPGEYEVSYGRSIAVTIAGNE